MLTTEEEQPIVQAREDGVYVQERKGGSRKLRKEGYNYTTKGNARFCRPIRQRLRSARRDLRLRATPLVN